jgi:L-lysine 6-transaminase
MKSLFNIKIDFELSKGSMVFDKFTNQRYLDLFSMYSTLPIGYNHPIFNTDYKNKIASLSHIRSTNNLFFSDELNDFFEKFSKYTFSDYIHLTCTGALAVEAAIKCAMVKKKKNNPLVLSLKRSFHGINSWGFLTDRFASTEERMRYMPRNQWKNLEFEEIIHLFELGDIDDLVAIVIEPIQCTAGDLYVPIEHLKKIKELCTKNNICLIYDEIQTGMGVTGNMWYSEKISIEPDILVFGKKAQVSGIVVSEEYSECLKSPVQRLEVTYDGDLIDAVRSTYILKAYEDQNLLERVDEKHIFFKNLLSDKVLNYRSSGLLIAFDFETKEKRDLFTKTCFERKLICNGTGERAVRIRPNLAINSDEMNLAAEILLKVLNNLN